MNCTFFYPPNVCVGTKITFNKGFFPVRYNGTLYTFVECSPVNMKTEKFNCCPNGNCKLDVVTGIVKEGICLDGTEDFMCSVCTRNKTAKFYKLGASCVNCSIFTLYGKLMVVSYCFIFFCLLFVNYKTIFYLFFYFVINSLVFKVIEGENHFMSFLNQICKIYFLFLFFFYFYFSKSHNTSYL